MTTGEESEPAQPPHNREHPKSHLKYWEKHIFHAVKGKPVQGPDGEKSYPYESVNYYMDVSTRGRRKKLCLGTPNQGAAARKAQMIYCEIQTLIPTMGVAAAVDKAIEKYRPKMPNVAAPVPAEPEVKEATIGDWIAHARGLFAGKPASFGSYVKCLRTIACDIEALKEIEGDEKVGKTKGAKAAKNVKPSRKQRPPKERFGGKGADRYHRKIDAMPLSVLSPANIQKWRITFVGRAQNPEEEKKAMISANSMMRQAASLWGEKIMKFTPASKKPTQLPFADAEYYPGQDMTYTSTIDVPALLTKARQELAKNEPEVFKALLLGIAAALRRKEIAGLLWSQVDRAAGEIRLAVTKYGSLKTAGSAKAVPIDPTLLAILEEYRDDKTGIFVIEGPEGIDTSGRKRGQQYRCNRVLDRLVEWLRANGMQGVEKPIHTLRKEAGSMISTRHGIHAAALFLRHNGIQVAAMHYVSHKVRTTVDITGMLGKPPEPAD